jgi:membrane protein implicated in regulation of membrane protease activity
MDNTRLRWSIVAAIVVAVMLSRTNIGLPGVPFNVALYGFITLAVIGEVYWWRRSRNRK